MRRQGFCILSRTNENVVYVSVNSSFFLHLKDPSGFCEVNTNISIDFFPQSPFSLSSVDENVRSVNCMQLWD